MDNNINYTIEDIAFGLSSVFLNEDNEECPFGLEDIDSLNNVCLKIAKTLDHDDLVLLANLRPDTFVNAIEEKRKIDEIMKPLTQTPKH